MQRSSSKYRNDLCYYDGKHFSSKRERNYYAALKLLEKQGMIHELETQVRFTLVPAQVAPDGTKLRAVDYVADFVFHDDNGYHVQDIKPKFTNKRAEAEYKKTSAYRIFTIKKKLMLERHGIFVEEINM